MVRVLASDGMDKAAAAALEKAGYEVVQQFYEVEELKEKGYKIEGASLVRKQSVIIK